MKVLLIARGSIDSEKSIGNFEFDQAIALKKCNVDVRVLAIDVRRKILNSKNNKKYIEYKGVPIYCYQLKKNTRKLPFSVKCKISQSKMLCYFHEITREWMPDLIHAHFGDAAYQALKIKKNYNHIPFIITEHFSLMNSEKPNMFFLRRMIKTYRYADKLICVSNSFKQNLEKTTSLKFEVLPNLLDPTVFTDKIHVKQHSSLKKPIKIISAGNYTDNKNFVFLIEILSKITEIDWSLEIYGSGNEYKNMIKAVHDLKLAEKIKIGNRLSREDLLQRYLESDIFMLLSKKETFGVVYIEAMACGLPVVSLDCGGTEDIINKNNGVIIYEKDKDKIRNIIKNTLNNVDSYNRQQIADEAYGFYNYGTIINRQLEIYNNLLK